MNETKLLMENLDFESSEKDLNLFLHYCNFDMFENQWTVSRFFGFGDVYTEAMREDMKILRSYSENKLAAMIARKQGLIPSALALEAKAESFYNQLPTYARW